MSPYRLIIFDRDGTLTYEDYNTHRDLTKVRPYPFVAQTLMRLSEGGAELAVATNQSGIGRGFWTREEVDQLHSSLSTAWDVDLNWHLCPHLPDDGCDCRKPQPGLIQQAMGGHDYHPHEVLMVGDSLKDAQAATAAGIDFALVLTGRGRKTQPQLDSSATVLDTIAQLEISRD